MTDIKLTPAGPIVINSKGVIKLTDTSGQIQYKDDVVALCTCGTSNNGIFCDGSHKAV